MKMKKDIQLFIVFFIALSAVIVKCGHSFGEEKDIKNIYKIFPVDEGNKVKDFRIFRNAMIDACRRKDVKFLLQHTDENIYFSFGISENTKEEFIKQWELDKSPARSLIWDELKCILTMGGVFEDDGSFSAPYTFALFPSGEEFDGFETVVCISSDVPLYANPSVKSKIIKKLSYDILQFSQKEEQKGYNDYWQYKGKNGWLKVKTYHSTEEGYIQNKYVRSPIDFRAAFKKRKDGKWVMTDFVCSD